VNQKNLVIIGSGNLAHALGFRWLPSPHVANLSILARSQKFLSQDWESRLKNRVVYDPSILQAAKFVVLAVKPKDAMAALSQASKYLDETAVLISVVAGVSIAEMRTVIPKSGIIRTMPNICSEVGRSVTGYSIDGVTETDRSQALILLQELGDTVETPEASLDPMTALFGSGPAYVLEFLSSIINTAVTLGLDADLSRQLALRMVVGTGELALTEKHHALEDIQSRVVSPGGTTEAMLRVLHTERWPEIMEAALQAAGSRATQLGREAAGAISRS
jgi:pyrroline-5-carboxylate reductase